MQINMDTRNNSQSFTAFKLCSGAESQLKKVLKPKDWVKFNEIIDEQLSNPVDINLFAHSGDKFYGRIVTKNNYVKGKDIYQYPFFESAISFFQRIAQKADQTFEQIKNMPEINVEDIMRKMRQ